MARLGVRRFNELLDRYGVDFGLADRRAEARLQKLGVAPLVRPADVLREHPRDLHYKSRCTMRPPTTVAWQARSFSASGSTLQGSSDRTAMSAK